MLDKKNILGVGITNATKEEILEYVTKSLKNFTKKYFIVTPNPEFLVLANKNPQFNSILNNAELASADGIGLVLAGKILNKELKGRVTGVELLESLCKIIAEKPITVGFLGGKGDVADKTAKCLVKKYPGLKVAFAGSDYNGYKRIDLLFVAFGAPKQEIWMSENLEKIPVRIAVGVGGAFDYISGRVQRAPVWVQKIGFEWLYRLIREPWRLKRQLSLLEFVWLVFKEKLKSS